MASRRVTRETLLEALRRVREGQNTSEDDGAMTTTELSKVLGITKEATYTLLDTLRDEIEVIWVKRPCRTGVIQRIPAYRLKNVTTKDKE